MMMYEPNKSTSGDWYPDAINLHSLCQFKKSANIKKRQVCLCTGAVFNVDYSLFFFFFLLKVPSKFALRYINSILPTIS